MSKSPRGSWAPATYHLADLHAVRAVSWGTATEDQQKRAMRWIIEKAADTYGPSFFGNDQLDMAHHEGRRFVGLQLVKAINMPASVLEKLRETDVG